MRRTIGRRAAFFAVMSGVCAGLVPATPPEFRWVSWFGAGLALFWALALGAEELATGRRRAPPGPAHTVPGTPFDPPASPGSARLRRGSETER
jgi:hypothetical protein